MTDFQLPPEFNKVNVIVIRAMQWLNGAAHIMIGLALAIAVVMFTWLFIQDVREAAISHNLVHGFLHALGTLMLLWSMSALITAEIRYLQGHSLEVETFIEVAMVVMLRKLIVMPVQDASPTATELLMWVGAGLMLGVMYFLIRWDKARWDKARGDKARSNTSNEIN